MPYPYTYATFPPNRKNKGCPPSASSQSLALTAPISKAERAYTPKSYTQPSAIPPNPAKARQVAAWLMMQQAGPSPATSAIPSSLVPERSDAHPSTIQSNSVRGLTTRYYSYGSSAPSEPKSQPTGTTERRGADRPYDYHQKHRVMGWMDKQPDTFSVSNGMPPSMLGACDKQSPHCPEHQDGHFWNAYVLRRNSRSRFLLSVLGVLGLMIVIAIIVVVVVVTRQKKA
ncbi:hypothetical protein VHEMI07804 [[Torrubiella] hemipterigena]|uniref:Uncharacterized protein n=1 Tax=[Torrubiella] hemipterigena TaxID=1531966 RepID=A0A0A1TBG8_9HYPO|nr:hypothetical protein VHEMI07804 [[Torrubiella] hemipterigena]